MPDKITPAMRKLLQNLEATRWWDVGIRSEERNPAFRACIGRGFMGYTSTSYFITDAGRAILNRTPQDKQP